MNRTASRLSRLLTHEATVISLHAPSGEARAAYATTGLLQQGALVREWWSYLERGYVVIQWAYGFPIGSLTAK